ncbi:MAG: hypothetical protein H6554_03920 [Chitinophagales bacterium]|nr:hypothetical protein [Chitinophagales bacterium]
MAGDFPATIRDPETAGTYYTTTFNILDEAAAAQAGCAPIGVSCVAEASLRCRRRHLQYNRFAGRHL